MTRIPYSEAREEFETLLGRYLWNDLDQYGKKRLLLLASADPEFSREFRELTRTDDLLTLVFPQAPASIGAIDHNHSVSSPDAIGHSRPPRSFPRTIARRKSVLYAIAAVLAAAMAVVALAYRGGYLNKAADVAWRGDCEHMPGKGNETRLRNVSTAGFCDASTRDGSVSVRIFPGSDASILPNAHGPIVILDQGAALVRGEKRPPGSEIRIITGSNSVRFLGTEVFVRRSETTVHIEVVAGAVEMSRSHTNLIAREMAALPEGERQKIQSSDPAFFANVTGEVLSPGKTLTIQEESERAGRVEDAFARLKAADKLTTETYREWRMRLQPDEESALGNDQFKSVSGRMDPARSAILRESWKSDARPAQVIESEKSKAGDSEKDDARSTIPSNMKKPAAQKPDPQRKQPEPRREVQNPGNTEEPHNVILTDGRTIKGRARQEGDFIIITAGGRETRIPRSDVIRIEGR